MPFPYHTVLITGATSGIGLELAERMVASGIFVIAVGRRRDRLDAFVAKHGSEKAAGECFDVSNLDEMPAWVEKITSTYPTVDSIVLNAGFQRSINFTAPSSINLALHTSELTTNYLSPLHMITLFLPHLISLSPAPTSIIIVSSGLAILPFPRCANYSASKAALHSLAWSLRTQLAGLPGLEDEYKHTRHIRVIEILPPAVQTELHPTQEDLVKLGQDKMGLPLDVYMDETWRELIGGEGEEEEGKDEILYSGLQTRLGPIQDLKRRGYEVFLGIMRGVGVRI